MKTPEEIFNSKTNAIFYTEHKEAMKEYAEQAVQLMVEEFGDFKSRIVTNEELKDIAALVKSKL